ncbi:MAG: hypothetical protein QOG67_3017 [Verrucomicrobiota bacterium]|jgi:hypothetical protein
MKITRFLSLCVLLSIAVGLSASSGANPSPTPALAGFAVGEVPATLRDGDIVFHDSGSEQSAVIKILTHSQYSHVGIYLTDAKGGFVYEAHNKVEKTPIAEWSDRPRHAKYPNKKPWRALRLKDHPDGLSSTDAATLKAFFTPSIMGAEYDKKFQWSDDKYYCSELVWKAYNTLENREVGKKETFRAFDFSSKEATDLATARYGGVDKIPLDEIVITPQSIYSSDSLQLIPPLTER